MIKPSNLPKDQKIQVLTCCTYSGKARVEKILARFGAHVNVSEEKNEPAGTGTTVTVMATKPAVVWVEYLLVNAGLGLLSQPYDPKHKQYYLVDQSLEGLKGAHERLHRKMPTAWSDKNYKPPAPKPATRRKPKAKRKPTRSAWFGGTSGHGKTSRRVGS